MDIDAKTATVMPVPIGSDRFSVEDLLAVAYGAPAVLTEEARQRLRVSRDVVEQAVAEGRVAYGLTTGFGSLADVAIDPEQVTQLQLNLVRSHAAGIGRELPRPLVRAIMALRAHALSMGLSGVRPLVVEYLVELLNCDMVPIVPELGSVGASGDLAPLAHVALALIGEGEVLYRGVRTLAREALAQAGLAPLTLGAKEGLALTNGTQLMASQLAFAVGFGEQLLRRSTAIAAFSLECLRGIPHAFDPELIAARPHPGAVEVAAWLRQDLTGSRLTTKPGEIHIQDAYSLRCLPQIHGAVWEALAEARRILEVELRSVTDNPIIFPARNDIISGGNFHGQPLAMALDLLGIAFCYVANAAERRIERLLNSQLSGLPPFLSEKPGVSSGLMLAQYTAAALASENKVLAHPASVDTIPTSANQEDVVSMGPHAGRKALTILENVRRIVALEWVVAAQATEFLSKEQLSPQARALYDALRKEVEPYHDQPLAPLLAAADRMLQEALTVELVERVLKGRS